MILEKSTSIEGRGMHPI